jgi:hypothetical protein
MRLVWRIGRRSDGSLPLQGAKLYRALNSSFVRFDGRNERTRGICFETFPPRHSVDAERRARVSQEQTQGETRTTREGRCRLRLVDEH